MIFIFELWFPLINGVVYTNFFLNFYQTTLAYCMSSYFFWNFLNIKRCQRQNQRKRISNITQPTCFISSTSDKRLVRTSIGGHYYTKVQRVSSMVGRLHYSMPKKIKIKIASKKMGVFNLLGETKKNISSENVSKIYKVS